MSDIADHDMSALKAAEQKLVAMKEELETRVERRTLCLRLLQELTVIANEADSVEDGLERALSLMCRQLYLSVGHVFLEDSSRPGTFTDSGIWWIDEPAQWDGFVEATQGMRIERGDGLLGDVVVHAIPRWSTDVSDDPRLGSSSESGVRAMLIFPILIRSRVVGVIEFCSAEPRQPDPALLAGLEQTGIQLGRIIERKRLERHIATLALREQRRIGQELHDTLGQQVTAIDLMLRTLRKKIVASAPEVSDGVDRLVEVVQETKAQVRALSKGLVPVDVEANGLPPALEELAEQSGVRFGFECTFEQDGEVPVADGFTATQLYHIAQEALNNAAKHGEADRVRVGLFRDGRWGRLEIRDDGVGLTDEPCRDSGRGMRIMRYRAGMMGANLRIESPAEGGTVVSCSFRLERRDEA